MLIKSFYFFFLQLFNQRMVIFFDFFPFLSQKYLNVVFVTLCTVGIIVIVIIIIIVISIIKECYYNVTSHFPLKPPTQGLYY